MADTFPRLAENIAEGELDAFAARQHMLAVFAGQSRQQAIDSGDALCGWHWDSPRRLGEPNRRHEER
jgi:hypothetical protein